MKHNRKYLIPLRGHGATDLQLKDTNKIIRNMENELEKQKERKQMIKISKVSICLAIVFLLIIAMTWRP